MFSSVVSPKAHLGRNVVLGHGTVVHDGVEIGDDTVIQEHCVIGVGAAGTGRTTRIGAGSVIRSHTVIYAGSTFGDRLETGHHVVIREGTVAGENLRVGNLSDVEGGMTIGDFCRFHGYVHVGKGSSIGHFVWLFSLTTLTNDPLPPSTLARPVTMRDGSVACVGVTLMPGTTMGVGAYASAGSIVKGEVPAGAVVSGPDGEVKSHVRFLMDMDSGTRHPWMRHYRSVYPESAQSRLDALLREILSSEVTF